ncbi:MAG: hypothetical protein O3A53_03815 [Acidobacteria bacterium]|nr:hypothetical protein [Acidobacteriota bacterium]MDA1233909.1 hypothetical protein [Acidobacteriota bacterium]
MPDLQHYWPTFLSSLPPSSLMAAGACLAAAVLLAVRILRRKRPSKYFPRVPTETLRLVPLPAKATWKPAAIEGRPAMHVSAEWRATNITDSSVQIVRAYVEQPSAEGLIVLCEQSEGKTWGVHEIAPHTTVEVSVDFWIDPPTKKPGKALKASVVFLDQFGNRHRTKRLAFTSSIPGAAASPIDAEWVPESSATSIDRTLPIELQVSAVLKEELRRYDLCGRRVGGLGSVQTHYGPKVLCGVGSVWREAHSSQGPLIVESTSDAYIESDNADSMVKLYDTLNHSDQLRFVAALRRRLGRYGECAPVGYLTLLVLFRTGDLREALSTARAYLQGDDGCGFSEFMLLLDGLLRFEHRRFSDMMLEDVEQFISGLDEYTFGIPDRLAEIKRRRRQIPLPIRNPAADELALKLVH